MTTEKISKTDEEWRSELTAEQYEVLRRKATETPFTGAYVDEHGSGVYRCAGCGTELFDAGRKFESGSGWPSFYQPKDPDAVETETDRSFFTTRTEVHCSRCGGHLGHIFEDARDQPTGLRYCINSAVEGQSSAVTSRCVTARTVRGPNALRSTPRSRQRSTNVAASGTPRR